MLEVSELKFSNMVAERWVQRPTVKLQEVVVWSTGLEYSPNLIQNLEREVASAPKESTAADPVLPCWGSSGEPKGGGVLNHQW